MLKTQFRQEEAMTEFDRNIELMDRPEIIYRLFFPRREDPEELGPRNGATHFVQVAESISIGCRFYPAGKDSPNILYFHGNGEIAADYDYVAPLYQQRGINLFVADYRGYGNSDGSPTCSAMIRDARPIFQGFVTFLGGGGFEGGLFVMGRSLGSAPAIEVAYRYQQLLQGLIVESGFASQKRQLARMGVAHLFKDVEDVVGFGNEEKIAEVRIPTLIIHGEEDEIIPVTEGRALYERSGAPRKYSLFVPGAGHNDLFERGQEQYMESIVAFAAGSLRK
jgi:alpha-beta hydrolase superfamily lysophospholipase